MSAVRLPAGCPAPVATPPPRGSLQSLTFSMPIDSTSLSVHPCPAQTSRARGEAS